jgi:hypothetical protein
MEIHKAAKLALEILIYNVDETGLFYRVKTDGSLSYKHSSLSG